MLTRYALDLDSLFWDFIVILKKSFKGSKLVFAIFQQKVARNYS